MGKMIFKIIFVIFLVLGSLYLYGTYVEPKILKVQDYKIKNEKITDNFDGFKIVHISDIHYGRSYNKEELNKLVKKINELEADIVVLTGDLLDRDTKMTTTMVGSIASELNKIEAKSGKYAINGNHELKFDEWDNIISSGGFINLNNDYDTIYNNSYNEIMISGLSTKWDKKPIEDKHSKAEDYINSFEKDGPIYKILLIHEPDYIDTLENNPYDLVLAGHSHGGQVRIPFVGALYKPDGAKKYFEGHNKVKDADLYISNGFGVSNFNIRLFNPPTINVYRLVK